MAEIGADIVPILVGGPVGYGIDTLWWAIATNVPVLGTTIVEPIHLDDVLAMLTSIALAYFGPDPVKKLGVSSLAAQIALELHEFVNYYFLTPGQIRIGFMPRLTTMRGR